MKNDVRELEQRVQEAEQRLRKLFEASLEGFGVHEGGLILDVNDTMTTLFGYARAELIGRGVLELCAPEDRDLIAAHIAAGDDRPYEVRAVRKDGSTFPGLVRGRSFDYGGRTLRVTAIQDLTEARRALAAMRAVEQRLQTVVANAPIVLFAIDAAGEYLVCEGRALAALGIDGQSLVGRNAADVWRGDERILANVRRCLDGEEFTSSGPLRDAWLETHFVSMRDGDGKVAGAIGVAVDMTERRRAEEERAQLLAQEQAARAAAEQAQRRSSLLAAASRELAATLEYEDTLRVVPRAAVPAMADWCVFDVVEEDGTVRRVGVVHADPAKAALAAELARFVPDPAAPEGVPRVLRSGRPATYGGLDDAALQPDGDGWPPIGTRRPEHLSLVRALGLRSYMCVPVVARGRTLGALTFVSATDPARYGADELALGEELAHRAALAVDSARLYRAAQEAIRARDEFLSIASHELRTPVGSLQLAVQSLLRGVRTGSIAHTPRGFITNALETMERQSKRLVQLVESLLDVSRISAERLELDLADVDLAAVAREVADQHAGEAVRAGCTLEVHAPAAAVGRWDRARLEQVVSNLLSNALKYGAGKPVRVSVDLAGATARLEVRDHGIGIPAPRQARIFERFERAVSSAHYGGLGLGLYIVRRVLNALGGSVRVASEPGAGATFVVELPCAGPPAGAVASSPGPP
ncbi:MAG TPA: ATP-binding protein [Myxococcota bacterium]|nr:ATP-binding protein [Myxococcota bacterium]